ncbi:hypothetical protein DM02DRAFT_668686 [Periconia macrospinosa]|uniref:Uncharacterized protein n=1 Tax=Periconia macrospinosa TaxID=97972 RepID=A0A2V1E6V4_9PLEO|nr:hypothetical protein DM02DRAFT_668686 [Periconia macrospinosa]
MPKRKPKGEKKEGRHLERARKRREGAKSEGALMGTVIPPRTSAKYVATSCTPTSRKQKSAKRRKANPIPSRPNIQSVQPTFGARSAQQPRPNSPNDQSARHQTLPSQQAPRPNFNTPKSDPQAQFARALAIYRKNPPCDPQPLPKDSLAIKLMRQPSPPLEAIITPSSPPHIRNANSLVAFLHSRGIDIQSHIDRYTDELDAARAALSSSRRGEYESAVGSAAERAVWLEEAAKSSLGH